MSDICEYCGGDKSGDNNSQLCACPPDGMDQYSEFDDSEENKIPEGFPRNDINDSIMLSLPGRDIFYLRDNLINRGTVKCAVITQTHSFIELETNCKVHILGRSVEELFHVVKSTHEQKPIQFSLKEEMEAPVSAEAVTLLHLFSENCDKDAYCVSYPYASILFGTKYVYKVYKFETALADHEREYSGFCFSKDDFLKMIKEEMLVDRPKQISVEDIPF